MQLKRNHKRNIVLGIAALLILYGLLDWIFKFNFSPSTVNNVTYVLMIGAFVLLFSKPKNKNTDQTPTDSSIEDTTKETKMNNQLNDVTEESEMSNQLNDVTEETDIKNQIQDASDKNDRNEFKNIK